MYSMQLLLKQAYKDKRLLLIPRIFFHGRMSVYVLEINTKILQRLYLGKISVILSAIVAAVLALRNM